MVPVVVVDEREVLVVLGAEVVLVVVPRVVVVRMGALVVVAVSVVVVDSPTVLVVRVVVVAGSGIVVPVVVAGTSSDTKRSARAPTSIAVTSVRGKSAPVTPAAVVTRKAADSANRGPVRTIRAAGRSGTKGTRDPAAPRSARTGICRNALTI